MVLSCVTSAVYVQCEHVGGTRAALAIHLREQGYTRGVVHCSLVSCSESVGRLKDSLSGYKSKTKGTRARMHGNFHSLLLLLLLLLKSYYYYYYYY